VTVTVEGLEPSTRGLTYRTFEGVRNSLNVDPAVTLYDEVQVGDLLVVNYIDAVVLKVTPGAKLTNFADTTDQAKATVTDPGVRIEQQRSQVVTIDEIDVQARTVVYHGADSRRVLRAVQDPALLKGLKAGDVVDITMTRERAISLARARR
jgi:Cu/Ag efflux protein CusF